MQTKFGPWKIADDDHRFVLRQNGTGVARVAPQFNTLGPDPNAERNFARLIAAAPDLYAVVKLVKERRYANFTLAEWHQIDAALSRVEQPQ